MSDLILVGGGLSNGLIALELARSRPDIRFTLLESGPSLGGNHTWSFHEHDLSAAEHAVVAPLVAHRWDAQTVRFPAYRRRLEAGYRSVSSERFARVLGEALGPRVRLNAEVTEIASDRVTLAGGEVLRAGAVIDGRGFRPSPHMAIRFQTFVGRELRFAAPHGLDAPLIMDATTPQEGGYRFTYVLPFTADTALVEDTAYADDGQLDRDGMRRRIEDYCRAQGWQPIEMLREEAGVLPITLAGDIGAFWDEAREVPSVGLRGNFFHPVTGYSLPDAVRVAALVAAQRDLGHRALFVALRARSERLWRGRGFFRALNRMLFLAGPPDERWRVMERFYRLPEGLVARFYAARPTAVDKLRTLAGKPPVPIFGALRALASNGKEREAA